MDDKHRPTALSELDDLFRRYQVLSDVSIEQKFLDFVELTQIYFAKYKGVCEELTRIQSELVQSKTENQNWQLKLKNARQMLDTEKKKRLLVERERNELEKQIALIKHMLNQGNINETKEKLEHLSSTINEGIYIHGSERNRLNVQDVLSPGNLSTINEDADTLGSIMSVSDLELTDGDELEVSKTRSGRSFNVTSSSKDDKNSSGNKRKSSPSKGNRSKCRKSNEDKENEGRVADDNATLERGAENHSKLDFAPSAPPLISRENIVKETFLSNIMKTPTSYGTPLALRHNTLCNTPTYQSPGGGSPMLRHHTSRVNGRQHSFATKMIYWSDSCQACEKRIKFGKPAYKCRDCRTTCHMECQNAVPLPCIPVANTPGNKNCASSIADFAPRIAPMVPAIIVHCTNEVENRGLSEIGVYRVPGAEREVKELRDQFIKGKGIPNLGSIDIYVICSAIKAFLRALKEPVIPCSQWRDFVAATEKTNQQAVEHLRKVILEMPQPNRDTLAWIVLHLQRVSESPECKMPATNLAKVFGPTLLGYSVPDPSPNIVVEETRTQQKVIELLLEISSDYWGTFVTGPEESAESRFASPEKRLNSGSRRIQPLREDTESSHDGF
ncbi:Rac GTPase-activating protein 1 [Armadillidium nasatum]|uniref:Rac GTPase-activating protein 1 n=1 Tax=Armadillidium nasatum TaxID=96803 RepID=A0A5N5TCZ8_9CRUS|nr:Rac GTPase-activating protein 1 [Armadillidium nasatum]